MERAERVVESSCRAWHDLCIRLCKLSCVARESLSCEVKVISFAFLTHNSKTNLSPPPHLPLSTLPLLPLFLFALVDCPHTFSCLFSSLLEVCSRKGNDLINVVGGIYEIPLQQISSIFWGKSESRERAGS